jgi:hypothetical protein
MNPEDFGPEFTFAKNVGISPSCGVFSCAYHREWALQIG